MTGMILSSSGYRGAYSDPRGIQLNQVRPEARGVASGLICSAAMSTEL